MVSDSTDRFNGLVAQLAYKAPVKAVATVPITLSGNQTVGGVAVVTDDRVLVTAQANPIENGIYNVESSNWSRAADFDGNRDVTGGTRIGFALAGVAVGPAYAVTGNEMLLPGVDPITFNIADGFFLSQNEINAGITLDMINGAYSWGDAMRYKAMIDAVAGVGGTDDWQAFQRAVDSGHPSFCSVEGLASIESTVVQSGPSGLDGGSTFTGSAGLRLERFSSNGDPIWQVWGVQNRLQGNSMQFAARLHDLTWAAVLLGARPDILSTDPSNTDTHHNRLEDFKVIGDQDENLDWLAAAVYVHSIGRRRGAYIANATYYNSLIDIFCNQWNKAFELSTDANFNRLAGCAAIGWSTAAFHMNASYGNRGADLRIEGVQSVDLNERFAIHYGEQNDQYGLETDTDSSYPIHGAWQNRMTGSAELTLDPANGKVVRLVREEIPVSATGTYGDNVTEFGGVMSGGIGRDGQSDDRAVGLSSDVVTSAVTVRNRGQQRIKGFDFRTLDQGPGSYFMKRDSWAIITGRESGMVASTLYDLFEINQIGNDLAGVLIKFTFTGKANGTTDSIYLGEIWWAVKQDSGVDTATKIFDNTYAFSETAPFTPQCIASDNVTNPAQYTKARVSLNVGAISPDNAFCSWKAELIHSNLNEVNLDWDADIVLLSGFFDFSQINVVFNVTGTLDDAQ